jgi:hypothetical protein
LGDQSVDRLAVGDGDGDLRAQRIRSDRRDRAAQGIARACPHEEPGEQTEGRDSAAGEIRFKSPQYAGHFRFKPAEGFDHPDTRQRETGPAASPSAGPGFQQRAPEQVCHRVKRVPRGLVAEADRLGAGRDAAFPRHGLKQPDAVPPDIGNLLASQRDGGFDAH